MQRLRASIATALLATSITTPFVSLAQVGAETTINQFAGGCHPITAQEKAGLQAMGATIPSNGMFCDKDKPLLNGGCAENPYPYLQTKNKTGRADSVSGLNSDFACRMFKFLKAADAAGMNIAIGSGYRSEEMQDGMYKKHLACGRCGAPVAPPGRSKHNFGLAVDLHYNGTIGPQNTARCIATLPPCKWAHSNEAQFGLRWPMEYEPWHIEPSGAVNGRQQPLPQGGWQSDDSGAKYTNTSAPYNPSMWNPSMAPQPQQFSPLGSTGTPSPTSTGVPTQTYTPNPNLPSNYDMIPLPSASSSIFSAPPPFIYPLSTTTNSSNGGSVSAYDRIALIGAGSTGSSTPTGTSLNGSATSTQLNSDLYNIDNTYTGTGGTNASDGVIAIDRIATTSVAVDPVRVTQTFSESASQPINTGMNAAQNQTLIVALLTTLRDLLVSYLNFLKAQPTYGFQGPWQMTR